MNHWFDGNNFNFIGYQYFSLLTRTRYRLLNFFGLFEYHEKYFVYNSVGFTCEHDVIELPFFVPFISTNYHECIFPPYTCFFTSSCWRRDVIRRCCENMEFFANSGRRKAINFLNIKAKRVTAPNTNSAKLINENGTWIIWEVELEHRARRSSANFNIELKRNF